MNFQDSDLQVKDLHQLSRQTGAIPHLNTSQDKASVMKGDFLFRDYGQGLTIHAAKVIERQNLKSSVELKPSISFNLILKGEVEFSIGGERHKIGAPYTTEPESIIECSAITLSQPEVLTRYLHEGRDVQKLNISVTYEWLYSRCRNEIQTQQLTTLFSQHAKLFRWQATSEQHALAETLFDFEEDVEMTRELLHEHTTIRLIGLYIDSLLKQLPAINNDQQRLTNRRSVAKTQLIEMIDNKITSNISLEEIAQANCISVSTLQRRFKKQLGMTVNEYIRLRRLDLAKSAIILRGLTIGEAAFLAGYNHSSNFTSAFKKQFAITPAELIRIHSNKP